MPPVADAERHADAAVLAEFRLDPAWATVRAKAACQALAQELARVLGAELNSAALSAFSAQMWADRGVNTQDELDEWMTRRDIDETRLRQLIVGEALRRWGERQVEGSLAAAVADQIQLSADYARLRVRATAKRAHLTRRGLLDRPTTVDITYQELLRWWAEHRPHLAPTVAAEQTEADPFDTATEFRRAIINEYHYVTKCHDASEDTEASIERLRDADMATRSVAWT